ncbi:uncharacterized protein LOC122503966 [Leptopilina heterotoma]|uniref:uncharacterized protein LOC122503966 n=1 Tax=Leptopilina heterotoma TaxID=63436 RepID=UPI001CAA08BF|nr:uncharacterized protein LOC122503966 [Leptopilina heterotoma]
MNNFRPILILIVNCIFSLVLSQDTNTNYYGGNLPLRDVRERTFNTLKILMNIKYFWPRLHNCNGILDTEINFLNARDIFNMMDPNINDTSFPISKAWKTKTEALKLFIMAKNKLSRQILQTCSNPDEEMVRKWISTELNKDSELKTQNPICRTLENSFLLLEVYKFVTDNLKKDDADKIFGEINIKLASIIKFYENIKQNDTSIRKKIYMFGQAKVFERKIYALYFDSLYFTNLDKKIMNIFNKIYVDNSKITSYKNENGSQSFLPVNRVFFHKNKTDYVKNNVSFPVPITVKSIIETRTEPSELNNNTKTTNIKKIKPNNKTTKVSSNEQKIKSAVKYLTGLFAVKYFLYKVMKK